MNKAKKLIYGNRWETGAQIGNGGQGTVFHCLDTTGVVKGKLALKSPKRPKKNNRFRQEILAVKKLDHPNIVKIIDHSDLDKFGEPGNIPYLVMPYAEGGDLSGKIYKKYFANDIDKTIIAMKDISVGLAAAHAGNIIHRDIKPGNILFTSDVKVVIGDFGICFIREEERITKDDEVVGPRHFIAPELEGGRILDVTNAADVYSLGKVAYYMISGGVVLPREALHENGNYKVFNQSERHELLGILLGEMICQPEVRIQEMSKVIERLEMIEKWGVKKRSLGLNDTGLSLVLNLQKRAEDTANAMAKANQQKTAEHNRRMAKQKSFGEWLLGIFEDAALTIQNTGRLKAKSDLATIPNPFAVQIGQVVYGSKGGAQLTIPTEGNITHIFQIHLCDDRDEIGNPISDDNPRLALIPFYWKKSNISPHLPLIMGYISQPNLVGKLQGKVGILSKTADGNIPLTFRRVVALSRSFKQTSSLAHQFSWTDWPEQIDLIKAFVDEAMNTFLQLINSGGNEIDD